MSFNAVFDYATIEEVLHTDYIGSTPVPLIGYYAPGTPVSLLQTARSTIQKFPRAFRVVLVQNNQRFVFARRPPDIGCIISHEPTEYDFYKRSEREMGGFYNPDIGAIVTIQEVFDRKKEYYEDQGDKSETIAHEAFHAFDKITGFSGSDPFDRCYTIDRLTDISEKRKLDGYFTHNLRTGRMDIAACIGSDALLDLDAYSDLKRRWPLTACLVAEFLDYFRDYDLGSGLTGEVINKAIHEAERQVLHQKLVRDRSIQDLISKTKTETMSPDEWEEYLMADVIYLDTELLRTILSSQGHKEALQALAAYQAKPEYRRDSFKL